jgi:O-antigen ligase
MTLQPAWRTRLFAAGAGLLAVWFGVAIAQQAFFWPAMVAGGLILFALARWQPLPLPTLVLGLAVCGYIVGNRGFAQVMLWPNFPLLPAEAVLMLAGGLLLVQCAWRHELPFRRDPLNLLLVAWIVIGTLRAGFDFREHGLLAIRDFAVVYYAAFFFLAQEAAREAAGRRFLEHVVLVSSGALLAISFFYDRFPQFFFNTLSFRGSPLIYYKGDLVGTFMAVGSVLYFLRYEERRRGWELVLSLALAGAVIATDNRASMLGLFVATVWLLIGRRWKFALAQGVAGVTVAAIILIGASVMNRPFDQTPLFGLYEKVVSLADPTGQRAYRGGETFNKGDNNLFRTTWWNAVLSDTVQTNPYIGMGFGYDLADRFVREYYPESGEEFAVRSPHNVLVTVFARMGAVGLSVLVAVMGVVGIRTWRAVNIGAREAAPWCAVWIIFVSACFGVVLEGPMGAVVFWTMLGLAHASLTATLPENARIPSPDTPIFEKREPAALPSRTASV